MKKYILSLGLACFAFCQMVSAQIEMPAFFSDHLVLQQRSNAKIWGNAVGKKEVKVQTSWDKQTYTAKPDDKGNWSVVVKTANAGGPYQIVISQANKVVLKDVLLGEVWLCSGQSNMDMPVKGYDNLPVTNSLDLLMDSPDPMLRLFKIEKKYAANPERNVKGSWQLADASSVAPFSAVGYQFASHLRKQLGVPVGIIQATWGGSPIEAWMDRTLVGDVLKERVLTNQAIYKGVHQTPGNLYNGMISPLIGYGIAGVIWYQGEQNRHNYGDYLELQHAMVSSWRAKWNIGEWPFYLVQLAPMKYAAREAYKVPLLMEAQLKLPDTLANSGVAILIDGGEEKNIHPANKTLASKRLAYLALAKTYLKKGIPVASPTFKNMVTKGDTVFVRFNNTPLGLTTYDKPITQFELAGTDKIFYPAKAMLQGNSVRVISDKVKQPVAVRYAFKDWAIGELYSVEGLPISAFRTDNWSVK
ncbi:sialate O-acetylesterase [Pedobacter xixiisoli]|uniref:Sialate O-acetylesterase n=1 Tax=Pedobacter xixiisoli TaxID=1476464 RepID=A0A285ZQ90_9SPHI|nr:sialate O-acetylesterase [Pedobacter xixiisoli]SOD11819.1 sialate O-acetylesterase [Pedobacter xixiisoli]